MRGGDISKDVLSLYFLLSTAGERALEDRDRGRGEGERRRGEVKRQKRGEKRRCEQGELGLGNVQQRSTLFKCPVSRWVF